MPHSPLWVLRRSIVAPRDAAALLLGLGLPRHVLLEAALLMAALGGILMGLSEGLTLPLPDGRVVSVGPVAWALVVLAMALLSSSALQVAGRLLGGQGDFDGALLMTLWSNLLGLVLELVVLVVSALSVELAQVVLLLGVVVLFWVVLNFTAALHGFGLGKSFLALLLAGLGTLLALPFVLTLILTLLGTSDV